MASKADNDIVVNLGLTQGYEFDSLGRIIRFYSTQVKDENTFDTIATNIFYDNNGNMIGKRSNSGVFYDTYYYEYYPNRKVKKETHCRETNSNLAGNEFKLGVQLILSQETFEYDSLTTTQFKKKCLNDEGRIYKQGIINTNEKGKTVNENYNFVVGWAKIVNEYKYDQANRIIEKIIISNAGGDLKEKSIYEYDETGNLSGEKRFKNDKQTQEISYLYDETKKILKSQITRYYLENRIGIIKFSYEFF